MSNANGKDRQPTDRRNEILDAAAKLSADRGYAAVSIRDLAQEIHTTPAALYHHFADKAAICTAALRYVFADKAGAVASMVNRGDAPEVALGRLLVWLAQQFSDDPILARLTQRELLAGDRERIALLKEDVLAAPFRVIVRLMKRLAPDRDAELSASSVLCMVMGYTQLAPVLEELNGLDDARERLMAFAAHAQEPSCTGCSHPDNRRKRCDAAFARPEMEPRPGGGSGPACPRRMQR